MQTYEYHGFDANGRPCRGLVEALSVKAAREQLAGEGILVDRLAASGREVRFPSHVRSIVYDELAELLRSGMEVVPALDVMIDAPELSAVRTVLAAVRDRLKEGAGLADAFRRTSRYVTPFETALLEAGEHTGSVPAMLAGLGAFLEEQDRLRHRIKSALFYPSIVLLVGVCVAVIMLGVLVPRASAILAGSREPVPALTAAMVGLGRWLLYWGWLPTGVTVCAVVVLRLWMHMNAAARLRCSVWAFRVPVWRHGLTLLVNLRFARTLAILLQGGVPLTEGLVMAGRATGSAWVAHLAEKQADAVRHGSSLSDAVRGIPPLAGSLPGWIRIGEVSGGLERLMRTAGERYHAQWERYVVRATGFIEPVLILFVGGFVLLVTLSVLLPIMSLTRAVTG
jgi:general secretion pathway protein F